MKRGTPKHKLKVRMKGFVVTLKAQILFSATVMARTQEEADELAQDGHFHQLVLGRNEIVGMLKSLTEAKKA